MPSRGARDLPDRLVLPLTSGTQRWYWLGGRPALDLVNTLRERWRRQVETLVTPADLGLWLARAGVLAEPLPVTPDVLEEARALREAIDACVTATVQAAPPPADAVALIDRFLVHAGARPQLVLDHAGRPALSERPAADSPRRALGAI